MSDETKVCLVKVNIEENTQSLLPFQPCSSICVTGATGSGKSYWIYRFLRNMAGMYTRDLPQRTLYCYGIYQPLYDEMKDNLSNFTLHEGLPTKDELENYTADRKHKLIILDDLAHKVVQDGDMELLFTQGNHHRCLSTVFVTQNMYVQGKFARTISLNTWYLVLFKNVRDASQVSVLGRQLYPRKSHALIEAYEDCMKGTYNYLIIDMTPGGEDEYRLRTRVFPGEDPIVYKIL